MPRMMTSESSLPNIESLRNEAAHCMVIVAILFKRGGVATDNLANSYLPMNL